MAAKVIIKLFVNPIAVNCSAVEPATGGLAKSSLKLNMFTG